MRKLTREEVLKVFHEVHGDTYSYVNFQYVSAHTKGLIICPEHGEFSQSYANHRSGKGCPKCADSARNLNRTHSLEWFILKATEIHGNKHSYDKVVYRSSSKHVIVTCKVHGDWSVTPQNYIYNRSSCPSCNESRGESAVSVFLDNLNIPFQREWRDHDCRSKRVLPFDFYLPSHRTLIEFDGPQHYQPSNDWYCEGIVIRDSIKNEWAKKNGYLMLRVRSLDDLNTLEERLKCRLDSLVLETNLLNTTSKDLIYSKN